MRTFACPIRGRLRHPPRTSRPPAVVAVRLDHPHWVQENSTNHVSRRPARSAARNAASTSQTIAGRSRAIRSRGPGAGRAARRPRCRAVETASTVRPAHLGQLAPASRAWSISAGDRRRPPSSRHRLAGASPGEVGAGGRQLAAADRRLSSGDGSCSRELAVAMPRSSSRLYDRSVQALRPEASAGRRRDCQQPARSVKRDRLEGEEPTRCAPDPDEDAGQRRPASTCRGWRRPFDRDQRCRTSAATTGATRSDGQRSSGSGEPLNTVPAGEVAAPCCRPTAQCRWVRRPSHAAAERRREDRRLRGD